VMAWNQFLEEMILSRPGSVFRAKGFLIFPEVHHEIVFQSVREIFSAHQGNPKQSTRSSLVVIGRALDEAEYRQAFAKVGKSQATKKLVR
jgi:G3E family GTPase